MSNRYCPACHCQVGRNERWKNGYEFVSCQKCGTLYVPRIPESASAFNYAEYYRQTNLSVPAFVSKRLEEIVLGFSPYRKNNRLLDIGFGAAVLLQVGARAGWLTEGVEVSRTAVEHAQQLGLNAFYGQLSNACYPDAWFDIVVGVEMLEHLPNPQNMVLEIARILRPGGLFWATTPHGRGLSSRLLGLEWSAAAPPEHLQLFSLRGVKSLLSNAGFHRIEVSAHGVNPCEMMHAFQQRLGMSSHKERCDSVGSSYQVNQFMTGSLSRRRLKNLLNRLLDVSRLGDSLKIRAEL